MKKFLSAWCDQPAIRLIGRSLRVLLLSYMGFCLIMFALQRRMIFLPENFSAEDNLRRAAQVGMEPVEVEGRFIGWQAVPEEADQAILIFHGNAGSAVHREYFIYLFRNLPATENHAIFILEYPGYGHRSGRPSERAWQQAGVELLDYAEEHFDEILLVGESLGGGVAAYLAGLRPDRIQGVLMITPFDQLNSIAKHHYPWLPTGLLLLDRFNNVRNLQDYDGPLGIVVAENDGVIPMDASRRLYEGFSGENKRFMIQEGADHNTLYYGPGLSFWEELTDFLRGVGEDS